MVQLCPLKARLFSFPSLLGCFPPVFYYETMKHTAEFEGFAVNTQRTQSLESASYGTSSVTPLSTSPSYLLTHFRAK